jgi:hypothetical protein
MRLRDMEYIGFKHQRENKQNSDKDYYMSFFISYPLSARETIGLICLSYTSIEEITNLYQNVLSILGIIKYIVIGVLLRIIRKIMFISLSFTRMAQAG